MAYIIEHEWEKGQTITAEKLNHMERGIAAAIGGIEALTGTTYDSGSTETTNAIDNFINGANQININGDSTIKGALKLVQNKTAASQTTNTNKLYIEMGATDNSENTKQARIWYTGEDDNELIIGSKDGVDTNLHANNITGNNLTANGTLDVTGKTTLNDDLEIKKTLSVDGATTLKGNLTIGTQTIYPHTILYGDLSVKQNATFNMKASVNSDLNVKGVSNLKGKLTVGDQDISGGTDTELWGTLTIHGRDSTDSSNRIAAILYGTLSVSRATTLENTLEVTGKATLNDELEVVKNTTLKGTLSVAGNSTINGELTFGEYNSANDFYKIAAFKTSGITLNQPTSFFNDSIRTEHMEITSRSIKQSIGNQTYDLISQSSTNIYFSANEAYTFIRGRSVKIVNNDLEFTTSSAGATYTYCFTDSGQGGFKLTANYDNSGLTTNPNHTFFHYMPDGLNADTLVVGGNQASILSNDTSLIKEIYINAESGIYLTTKLDDGIRINNNTKIYGILTVDGSINVLDKITATVEDDSTLDGKKGYKYNYTLLTSSTLGLFSLQCSGTDNLNQPLTKTPSLFSYRPYGFESESYLTIGGPTVLLPEGDNGCVEKTYIRAKENIILSPTNSTGKVSVNSDLHIGYQKSLYINNTALNEDDITHLHTLWNTGLSADDITHLQTLWNNYQTQNGGEE